MTPLRLRPWMIILAVTVWIVALWLLFTLPEPAGGQGVYPPPTYLPPPAPVFRPTPTTTPGPVCCVVYAPAISSGNITAEVWP